MNKYKKRVKQKQQWFEKLSEALSSLTEKQRRRLYLRFWVDWTYQQIAEQEGVNRQNTHESVRRGLLRIKKLMTNVNKGGR